LRSTRRHVSPGARRATLAGLKPSGGHFNSGPKDLRAAGYVVEANGLVAPTPDGLKEAGEVSPAPSTPAARLDLWCGRLPAPAPEMLRTLAAQGERYIHADELAGIIGKQPSGGHWNSGIEHSMAQPRLPTAQGPRGFPPTRLFALVIGDPLQLHRALLPVDD